MVYLISLFIIIALAFYFLKGSSFLAPKENHQGYTIDDEYNSAKVDMQKEIDDLLSKMGKNGIQDLSEKQKERLQELSKKLK